MTEFRHRLATEDDVDAIILLMDRAITQNMKAFLSAKEIEFARESMGLDRLLIDDGTYFVIEALVAEARAAEVGHEHQWVMVGCGGWGRRKTLYGGDHTLGRDDRFTNPATDAARIRAMYTDPDWVRQGVGALLLELGEAAARDAGYKVIELGATTAGLPLYIAKGYEETGRSIAEGTQDIHPAQPAGKLIIKMRKLL